MADSTASAGSAPTPRVTFLDVLRRRGFRNLWLGQIVSQIGDYFAFLAMTVVVSGFASDQQSMTLAVSGMMIAFTLPRLLFGVIAGVFVDRWDRRRTMIVSDLIRATLTLGLIPAFLNKNLWLMYAMAFAMSTVGTLFGPAKQALLPRLVPDTHLLAANSLSQTSQMLATLIGPALAGASFQLAGPGNQWFAFLIDSISFLVSAVAIWSIREDASVARTAAPAAGLRAQIRQVNGELMVGLRALLLNRTITTMAAVMVITMLGAGAINVLFLVFLRQRFGFVSSELAWRASIMDIAVAAGMIGASVLIGNFLSHVSPKWLVVNALIGIGITVGVFCFLPDYWTMVGAMLFVGIFNAPINAGVGTLLQLLVPNEQLGRVGGGLGTLGDAASLASMSLAGALGAALGIPVVFVLGGLFCIAGGVLAWVTLPAISARSHAARPAQPDVDAVAPRSTSLDEAAAL